MRSALTTGSSEELVPHPLATGFAGQLGGVVDGGEFVVGEADVDGVAARVFAGRSAGAWTHATNYSGDGKCLTSASYADTISP